MNLSDDWDVIKVYARQYASLYLKDNSTFWGLYQQNGYVPLNYVIDTAGIVRYVAEGWNENAVRQVIEQYLPDPIQHDVGVTRLIAPTGSVDSGTVVTPACSLYNYRSNVETYPVRMRIGADYDTTVTVTGHQPGTAVCVQFPQWTALERGSIAVACSTELATDDIASNDVATTVLTVNVDDIAVTAILVPLDTVELGRGYAPAVEVRNLGTVADMARVRFYISDFYFDTVRVALQPGKTDTTVLATWIPGELGSFPVRCSVATLKTDLVTDNNELTKSVYVGPAGIEERPLGDVRFALLGSGQNPARRQATIRYSLAQASPVELRIYSTTGELVRVLESGIREPGSHQVVWDGRDELGRSVGRGTWFCRMTAGAYQAVGKLTTIE
ncbi:hypothetical protein JXD38_07430 [candidate division WOR-3 bacterium]|nr:hypothetical protein [candidate division WOR-3 bacterium]